MGSASEPLGGRSLARQGPSSFNQSPIALSNIASHPQQTPPIASQSSSLIASLPQPAASQWPLASFRSLQPSVNPDPSVLSPRDLLQIATIIHVVNAIRMLEAPTPPHQAVSSPLTIAAAQGLAAISLPPYSGPGFLPLPHTLEPLQIHAAALVPEGPTPFTPVIRLAGSLGPHGAPVSFLVDSGGSALFMSSETAKRCGLIPKPSGRTVRLADGTVRPSAGTVTANCSLRGQAGQSLDFEAEFCVTELLGHEAILGMPWLSHFNPQVSWPIGRFVISQPPPAGTITLTRYEPPSDGHEEKYPVPSPAALLAAASSTKGQVISRARWAKMMRKGQLDLGSLEILQIKDTQSGRGRGGMTDLAAASADEDSKPQHPGLTALLREYADVSPDKLGPVDPSAPAPGGIRHSIELLPGAKAHASPLRRYSPLEDAEIRRVVEEQLLLGRVKESTSPWGAMVLLARKKDGTLRFCVDYRILNNSTLKNRYALPLADDCFDRARGACVFSKLDLHAGFWQIPLDPASAAMTAFRTRFGHYEYTVLPMGLCNAPGTFMHVMNSVFRKQLDRFLLVFLDDIFIYSANEEEHLVHLREALEVLRANRLFLKPSKCEWMKSEVEFLGHRVGREGLSVDPHKVDAVRDWPVPKDVTQVRSFLGLAGYYRRFLANYSRVALPLTELTKDDVTWHWDPAEQTAFEELKRMLICAPVLKLADPALPFVIHCDASGFAIGGCLMQDHGEGLQPVSYLSMKMNGAETRYAPHEQELLALVYACKSWRHYLHSGKPFTVLSDHQSLRFFTTQPLLSARQARWKDQLAEFDFTIKYIEGPKNVVADALSRRADHKSGPEEVTLMLKNATEGATREEFLASMQLNEPGPTRGPEQPVGAVGTAHALTINAAERSRRGRKRAPKQAPHRLRAAPPAAAAVAQADWTADRVSNQQAAEQVMPAAPDRPEPNSKGIINMPSQRCTADTKAGKQCGARTKKGQLCFSHRKQRHGIRIKPSTYGLGLFATRAHNRGDDVAVYSGDLVRGRNTEEGGPYFLGIRMRGGAAIDAARTNTGDGRWANDPRGMKNPAGQPIRANCKFVTVPGEWSAKLRTLRAIAPGEELLLSYGSEYWKSIRDFGPSARAPRPIKGSPAAVAALEAVAQLNSATIAFGDFELIAQAREAAQRDEEYRALLLKPGPDQTVRDGLIWQGKRLVIPDDLPLRTLLISELHDTATGGHFGRDKTQSALRRRFLWKGMMSQAAQYVSGCDMCQRVKHSQQATPGLLMPLPVPEEIDSHWTMDFVTGLPRTARGRDAIQGHFSRGGSIKRLAATDTTVDASRAADCFIDSVVRHHGIPASIVSDRGPQFVSRVWRTLWSRLGTSLSMSTAYHPQTDGLSEREQRTMSTWLRAFCSEHPEDWDQLLPLAELALNCMPQAASGIAPYELLYGRNPAHSVDRALSNEPPSADSARELADVPAAEARWKQMAAAWTKVRGKLQEGQRRMAAAADRHRRELSFNVNDQVLLSTQHLKIADPLYNAKLAHLYCGPFRVTRVINANAYELELPEHMRIHSTVNISHLREYRDGRIAFPGRPAAPGLERPPPEAMDAAGQPAFVVERVLAQKARGKKARYLVLWKGYPYSEASWEPAANLDGAKKAIDDYVKLVESQGPSGRRRRGRGPQ